MKQTVDKVGFKINGFAMFFTALIGFPVGLLLIKSMPLIGILMLIGCGLILPGFYTISPNDSRVLIFVGNYTGTVKDPGFWWSNPFATKTKVSLRVRNFQNERLKVNDANGNPIEIAAVIVWKVTNPASAVLDVDSYQNFVLIQSETALRSLATHYPYDAHDGHVSLRGNPDEVAETLRKELENRLHDAGVQVLETRLSHLAYAPEIAQAMLRRQQAQAVIAARQQIVEGAVGMVEMALKHLSDNQIVHLDEERKANMVNNLLVALVSENQAQPVLNAGTLY